MREIKFRAMFHNGQWTYSNPKRMSVFWEAEEEDLFIPETLTQFTGLLDKNKKEIYEGDIVKYEKYIGGNFVTWKIEIWVIVFKGVSFQGCPKEKNAIYTNSLIITQEETIEVIGNIYQHPELLEEAK